MCLCLISFQDHLYFNNVTLGTSMIFSPLHQPTANYNSNVCPNHSMLWVKNKCFSCFNRQSWAHVFKHTLLKWHHSYLIDFSALGITERKIFDCSVAKLFLISRFDTISSTLNVLPSFDHCVIYTERFILNLEARSFSTLFSQVEIWTLTYLPLMNKSLYIEPWNTSCIDPRV